MLLTAIGISDDLDLDAGIEEVLSECNEQLGENSPQVGIFFTSCMTGDLQSLLKRIKTEYPQIGLVGCTTDGEISHRTGFIEDSLALVLFSSDNVEFAIGCAENISKGETSNLKRAVQNAVGTMQQQPKCAFIFPDGLSTLGTPLDQLICSSFGDTFPVFGGTAGDHFLLTGTHQFYDDQVLSDAAPFLLIGGQVEVNSGVQLGPVPTGLTYDLGKFDNNIVYEIGGKSAKAFYEEHLGESNEQITQFPLAVYEEDSNDFYLRDPLSLNHENGTIAFVGTFRKNSKVRLTLTSRSDVLNAADRANRTILQKGYAEPDIFFIFSCTSQRHVLGSRTNDKFSLLQKDSRNIPYFGFYCYGELAPFAIGEQTRFHNDTYVIVSLTALDTDDQ